MRCQIKQKEPQDMEIENDDMELSTDEKVDDDLYSRQLYVMGHDAQRKMTSSSVLIVGLKGLGVEIAKNVILMGIGAVYLLDPGTVEIGDLSANFYLKESDIGKPRDQSCLGKLSELNNYVKVSVITQPLDQKLLSQNNFSVVVLTETPLSNQIAINDYCHDHGIKFISGDVRGLLSAVFVDLGEEHIIIDINGERPHRGLIASITKGNPGIATMHDMRRHGLSDGDYVTFEEVEGMTELNDTKPIRIKVINPSSFSIGDTSRYSEYVGTKGYFNQVKMPQKVSFQKLADVIAKPKIIADFMGVGLPLHCLYQAFSKFQETHSGKLPAPNSPSNAKEVIRLAQKIAQEMGLDDKEINLIDNKYLQLARCAGAILNPMAAYVGGIIGQEIVKACSGKFTPINQYYYFAATEVLPTGIKDWNEFSPQNSRYDSQIAVLGNTLHKKLQAQNYFVVGAGAIGCEMLKNFALMGIATSGGEVHVTDMDIIEKSNLSRQFLFREKDIKQLKSKVAANAARAINPNLNIKSKALRVGASTEAIYNDSFWDSLDGVITALDNIEARLYVDQRCVLFQKPLIDSGTLGTKGNTQVVVPYMTESYGSSRDPPEESIPICTLKNFPNKIEHTIQWARDLFEGYYKQGPHEVNAYATEKDYLTELYKQPNLLLPNVETITDYLVKQKPQTFADCIDWARQRFQIEFSNNINQLLHSFPPDSKTNEGMPFWSGPKRSPKPLKFDMDDALHLEFIIAAANLRAFNYGIQYIMDPTMFKKVLTTVLVPKFQINSLVKIAATDEEQKKLDESGHEEDDYDLKVKRIIDALPTPNSLTGIRLNLAEFEKDDPTNFHIDFITACSNCRARNYGIKEKSKHETKFIAGKIIPAIATTTACVTGLVCLEMYKLIQPDKKIEDFKNTFLNLALPLFAGSDPISMGYTTSIIKGKEWNWTIWDRIDVDIGDVTMEAFMAWFMKQYGLEINMLSLGEKMLYYNFMGLKKAVKERLKMPMSKVVESVSKEPIPSHEIYLILEACCNEVEDEDEEVDVPSIKFKFR